MKNGFPFSKYFAHVDKKKKVPVRSLVISVVFCALYGVLYFASSTAFNSVVTSAIIGLVRISPSQVLLSEADLS